MNHKMPRTPFSTRLSGSAKETEGRLKNLFSGPKRRPPVLLLALVFALCLLCGNLVSCQRGEEETPNSSSVPAGDSSSGDGMADGEARWMLYWEKAVQTLFEQREDYSPDYGGGEVLFNMAGEEKNLLLAAWTPGAHTGGFRNLLLGCFDQEGALTDFYEVGGDSGLWSVWEEGNVLHLLCANSTTYTGEETSGPPMYFQFDGKTLTQVDEVPETGRKQLEDVPERLSQWESWGDHKYLPRPGLVEVYRRKGITYDNQSLFEPDGVTYKPMPTRADMLEVLSENPDAKNLALVESRFVTGSAKRLGQATNVDLDNQFVVIDTSEIGKDLLAAGTFTATDFCTEKCKESRVKKKALILDELWALIGASSNPQAAEFVLECFKTYRAFGAAVIGATQDLNDFLALENGKFGRAILNNSRIKVVLPLEEEEAVRVKEVMGLSNEEMMQVIRSKRGEGLLCAGHNRISVAFQSTQLEYDWITTSRADLEAQMLARQQADNESANSLRSE